MLDGFTTSLKGFASRTRNTYSVWIVMVDKKNPINQISFEKEVMEKYLWNYIRYLDSWQNLRFSSGWRYKKSLYFYDIFFICRSANKSSLSHGHYENHAMRITRQTIKSGEHKLQISNNPKNIKRNNYFSSLNLISPLATDRVSKLTLNSLSQRPNNFDASINTTYRKTLLRREI